MTGLLNIGEFARNTHLSIRALRHYHDVGVLVPAVVDPVSGYRRYSADQVPVAQLVRRLRDLDMPIPEVRAVLDAEPATRHDAIAAHLRRMEAELERTRDVVRSLRDLLERPALTMPVEVRTIDAMLAVAVEERVGHDRVVEWCTSAFLELDRNVAASGLAPTGPGGAAYPSAYFTEGVGEVMAYLPVSSTAASASPAGLRELPGGDFAVALHHGAVIDLDRTYAALGAYVRDNLVAADGPIREHYLVSPADTDQTDEWRTEVCWPVERGGVEASPASPGGEGS